MSSRSYLPTVMTDDIVISGMSGRFPESDNVNEFADNLFNNADLFIEDDRRWPIAQNDPCTKLDLYGMNQKMAKLKNIDKFDGLYFGLIGLMADQIDPQGRILLETTYEAIVDSGINPQDLRGSDTGVYIGYSSMGMPDGFPDEVQPDSQSSLTDTIVWYPGSAKCIYANRISFIFDFKGKSMVIDTACSSSVVALDIAINDLRLGKCQQAIVGGVGINLQPFTNHIYQRQQINSKDGIPKVWDEKANGFVRGETVSCIFLQKKSNAKRIYATVLNTAINIDGNKKIGMFFPSSESQEELMVKSYTESGLDPLKITYFEAHGTGTEVGDTQEAKAIYNAYCVRPKREAPLPIGLLKSNIGHTEAASGLASIVKCLISFENECIPSNLHFNKIKPSIADMCPPLQPITKNMSYTPGIAALNNFGLGGVNGHVLLEPNYKTSDPDNLKIADPIPRIVNICCRTEQALNQMFDFIEKNPNKISRDFLALLTDTMKTKPNVKSSGFPHRGSLIIKQVKNSDNQIEYQYKRQSTVFVSKSTRPLWFLFPGLGGQWSGMAKALMKIDVFAEKIEECHKILSEFDIDLKYLLLSDDKSTMNSMTNKFCATTALQIALIDVLYSLDITPDGIIGHSFGEIACAYADKCLDTREALLVTYIRGKVTESDSKIPKGLMAVVGLSWEEMTKLCTKGIDVVCNNADNTVVISGLYNETKQLIESLINKNIFIRELDSNHIPYHSKYLKSSANDMKLNIEKVITQPKKRSKTWISTAILESVSEDKSLKYASADYFVHNLVSPVYFYNKLRRNVPNDAVILEIGPHGLFGKVVSKTLENSTYLSLIRRDQNDTNIETLLTSIGKLYEFGYNPAIEQLYPRVEWPVSRNTQSISSLIRWQHSDSHLVKKYPDYYFKYTASDMNVSFDMSRNFKSYLPDHCIDGSVVFPATGYLMLVWRQLAASRGKIWNQIPIVFEEVQFRKAVFLSETEPTRLKVRFHDNSGEFVVMENSTVVCMGRCFSTDECPLRIQNIFHQQNVKKQLDSDQTLETNDIYKELKAQGYDYGEQFRGIRRFKRGKCGQLFGQIQWNGNWITFLDSLFQTMALTIPFRKLMVPVMISSLRCDPKVFFNAIADSKIIESSEETNLIDCRREELIENKAEETKTVDIFSESNTRILETMIDSSFHKYKSLLSFYCDVESRIMVTNGLEVEDLLAIPVSRKANGSNELKLETYQFIPNTEMDAIYSEDKKQIQSYIENCTDLAKDVIQMVSNSSIESQIKDDPDIDIKEQTNDKIYLKIFKHLFRELKRNRVSDKSDLKNSIIGLLGKPEYDLTNDLINQLLKSERLLRPILDMISENNVPNKEIKVLEMNLSKAIMAKEVDYLLASAAVYPIEVNYTLSCESLTDLSDDFKNKSFKLCEWQPKSALFPINLIGIDLILLKDESRLWDLNLEQLLQDIYDSLSSNGFLLTFFRYKLTEPEILLNQLLDEKQPNNSILEQRIAKFTETAKQLGFIEVCVKSDSMAYKALLLRKSLFRPSIQNQIQSIEIDMNYENWLEKLKQKLKKLLEIIDESDDTKLWLIANNSSINGIIGLTNSVRLEPGGDKIRCIFDYDNYLTQPINSNKNPIISEILRNDLAINVIKDRKLGTYRHLNVQRSYDKILTNDYFLNVGQNKDLSSLQWFDSKNLFFKEQSFDINNKQFKQTRCNIYFSGLNFKDVMFATGRLISGPETIFFDNAIGFEFSGRRSDTGHRVCGFSVSRCMASFVDTSEHLITEIPEHWSMEEAVTVLSTYITVWYGLIERAHLNKYESILIHSGAGGVGQAAISVCQYYNCDIYVTVGTEEKKKFLIDKYGIPANNIFNSRDIQFKYQLMATTEGKGVNLVLNSLTGEKLDASFQCLSKNGRFVEIGKYDLILNKRLGMFAFLKNISLIGVSVDQIILALPEYANKFFNWMHQNSNNGCVKPINYTVFNAGEADQAFRYMTTGKHIGKLLIRIREEERQLQSCPVFDCNKTVQLMATVKTYFDSKKVFIITGGLGGFGLELINWMIYFGARKFVLTSRVGIKTSYQRFYLKRLETLGNKFKIFTTNIKISVNDLQSMESTEQLLKESLDLGPIGGVFHLSLILNDCLLQNQTIDQFESTFNSKVNPCLNLDRLTRDLNIILDYFVVFSSISSGKGNVGQTNYSFANSLIERVCEKRRSDGLHGLAIQWGPIDDVGVLSDSGIDFSLSAVVKQRIYSCLEVLDKFLQCSHPIVSSVVRAQRMRQEGSREHLIVGQIWNALGVDPNTTPDHLTLGEIGIESLFAIELQQGLEKDYDIKISLSDVKSITVRQMKDFQNGKVDELKKFAADIKEARTKLNKKKFIIPDETHTYLNSVRTGKPIYFLPPIEGIFSTFESLAKKIDRPVIGLNWTRDMDQLNSIKDLSKHFTELLNHLSPNQNYDIVGHFYGALIASKMLRKASIGRAVIIDVLSNTKMSDDITSDDNIFKIVSKFIFHEIPKNVEQRILRDLSSVTDVNEKINRLCAEIKEFGGKSLVSKDLDEIMKNSFKRAKIFTNYRTKLMNKYQKLKTSVGKKFLQKTGKLLIIKPFEESSDDHKNDVQDIFNSYFIPVEGSDQMLEKFQANPDNILFENDDKIAMLINDFFIKF